MGLRPVHSHCSPSSYARLWRVGHTLNHGRRIDWAMVGKEAMWWSALVPNNGLPLPSIMLVLAIRSAVIGDREHGL